VISGKDFATSYKDICSKLDLKINQSKTIESKDSFEFAKRFYKNSEE
jgi:hypothetical protein